MTTLSEPNASQTAPLLMVFWGTETKVSDVLTWLSNAQTWHDASQFYEALSRYYRKHPLPQIEEALDEADHRFQREDIGTPATLPTSAQNIPRERPFSDEELRGDAAELSDDDRTVRAISILNAEGLIKHKYDYTWVMQVINETDEMPTYDSPQSFLTHIAELQEKVKLILKVGLPDISNMNKELAEVTGTFPNWRFIDIKRTKALGRTVYRDITETNRRINIAKRYYNAYKKGA